MEKQIETIQADERKTYVKPAILHELKLEARAGGTLTPPRSLDGQEQ
jgi:hypothetical protein